MFLVARYVEFVAPAPAESQNTGSVLITDRWSDGHISRHLVSARSLLQALALRTNMIELFYLVFQCTQNLVSGDFAIRKLLRMIACCVQWLRDNAHIKCVPLHVVDHGHLCQRCDSVEPAESSKEMEEMSKQFLAILEAEMNRVYQQKNIFYCGRSILLSCHEIAGKVPWFRDQNPNHWLFWAFSFYNNLADRIIMYCWRNWCFMNNVLLL